MEITAVEVRTIDPPYGPDGYRPTWVPNVVQHKFPQTIIRLFTDNGLSGYGATNCFGSEVHDFLDEVSPALLGETLESKDDLNRIWSKIIKRANEKGPESLLKVLLKAAAEGGDSKTVHWWSILKELGREWSKLSLINTKNIALENRPWCVNVALWDLLGRYKDEPICDLLGRTKDKIKAYASTGELVSRDMVDFAKQCESEGFEKIKLRVHRGSNREEDLRWVRKVIDETDLVVGVDANQAWTPLPPYWTYDIAEQMALELDDMGAAWLEEPLGGRDLSNIGKLADRVGIPIVGAEIQHGVDFFSDAIEAYDIVNPDIMMSCGISEGIEIAEMAADQNKRFTPHTWDLGPAVAAGLHVACAIDNCTKLEYPYDPSWPVDYRDSILDRPIEVKDGYIEVPDRPGLGYTLDENELERHADEVDRIGSSKFFP